MRLPACAITLTCSAILGCMTSLARSEHAFPVEGFVDVNGVQLQYLDWGGTGRALILIHGLAANPHVYDDLAPAFIDRFHVISYARRGHGGSDVQGPYDVVTLTTDLRGFMDALGIAKAALVGHSAGGGEITEMAATHPERVDRIVYLDAGYDLADPDFRNAVKALPQAFFDPPPHAMASLDTFRAYFQATFYPELDDMRRVEGNLRQKIVIRPDGTLRYRTSKALIEALYAAEWANERRGYVRVRCPALAIYAEHLYDLHIADPRRREDLVAYEQKYWQPFQEKSVERIRRELAGVEIARVPGAHANFFLMQRERVVDLMRRFLDASTTSSSP
jgi:pimeloyl-ACP methyl ester carboxylesterase